MNMMAIDRSKGRQAFEQFMRRGPEFEKRGWWVTLFPEGTRVPMGEHVRWKRGAHVSRVRPVCRFCPLPIMLRFAGRKTVLVNVRASLM